MRCVILSALRYDISVKKGFDRGEAFINTGAFVKEGLCWGCEACRYERKESFSSTCGSEYG